MMTGNRGLLLIHILLNIILGLQTIYGAKTNYVTCGSVFKLLNVDYRVRLHSHDVKYGTGSGQQSVTGTEIQEDANSHWTIWLIRPGDATCERGEPIKCGDSITLQHLTTKKNLHSHFFQSPLSGRQEISCYGEDGVGDSGDAWDVECSGDKWLRDSPVKLRHKDTGAYLSVSGRTFGRPINGQMEVIGSNDGYQATEWKVAEGLFIHTRDASASKPVHTEL